MVKRMILTAAMALSMTAGGAAFAAGDSVQTADAASDFSYYVSGNDVIISYAGEISMGYGEDTDVIIAVYDNGELVNTTITGVVADTQSYSMDDMIIRLSETPDNASVKMFVWTADGKLIPKTDIRDAAKLGSVSFNASDVIYDDPEIGKNYVENKTIPVYSSVLSAITKYAIDDNADMYVNGFYAGGVTNNNIKEYILNNENSTTTLVDFNGDNVYDCISVEYYTTAVVASVQAASGFKNINFKLSDRNPNMKWSDDADITFVKNGQEISYSDIGENDILSIKYDILNTYSLNERDFYYVLVSSDTVTGVVKSKDEEKNTVSIDGADYEMSFCYAANDMELLSNYTLYLDAFGRIAYFDEWESYKNYGVVVAMYQEEDKSYPTVQLITAEGETVGYECKDAHEADSFYNFAADTYNGFETGGFTNTDIADRLMNGQTVCTYSLTDGRIKLDKALAGLGGEGFEFKALNCKLGSYQLDNRVTRIIDMEEYISGNSDRAYTMQVSDFADESEYTAYLYDKNSSGVYRFAIVFSGAHSLRPTDSFAVVQRIVGETNINGMDCVQLEIAKDGEKNIDLYVESDNFSLNEGSVFVYAQRHNGYVEYGDYCVIMTPDGSYDMEAANTLAKEWFSDGLGGTIDTTVSGEPVKEIAYNGHPSYIGDYWLYFGPAHMVKDNFIEICTGQDGGLTDTYSDVVDLHITEDTLSYIYDYGRNEGSRVSTDALRYSPVSRFSGAYENEYIINWAAAEEAGIKPDYVLAKVVDGKLAELVGFLAPGYDPSAEPSPEPDEERAYGAVTSLYRNENGDYEIILAADDGELKTLNISDESLIAAVTEIVDPEGETDSDGDGVYSKGEVISAVGIQNTVIAYTASENILKTAEKLIPRGGEYMKYNESAGKLGGCFVSDESTRLLDVTYCMHGLSLETEPLQLSMLDDGGEYTAYMYDKSSCGDYRFAIVFEAVSVKAESSIAVVQRVGDITDIDGTVCTELLLCKDGSENVSVFFEGDDTGLIEGSVVAYVVGNDGYAETYYEIYSPVEGNGYTDILANALKNTNFSDVLNHVQDASNVGVSATKYPYAKTPDYATTTSKDVVLYFGIVSKKSADNLELFVVQEDGQSSLLTSDLQSFSVAGANSYVYEYGSQSRHRVSVGTITQNSTIFNSAYATNDRNEVQWDLLQYDDPNGNYIQPALALVKVVDGDVLDVVYYTAP